MFSFHKPRVYRSTEGCCICRAKSSSSRFTDSQKYEEDAVKCFNLIAARKGEICNACVLLVKRFKRLPNGSTRHWGHVVDARSGPGTKSMTKINKKMKDEYNNLQQSSNDVRNSKSAYSLIPEKFAKILKKTKKNNTKKVANIQSLCSKDQNYSITLPLNNSTAIVAVHSFNRINKRKPLNPKKNYHKVDKISFVDVINWKLLNICCGIGYENDSIDALIIDIEKFKPCAIHSKNLINRNDVLINSKLLNNSAIAIKKYHLFSKRQSDINIQQQLNSENLINFNNVSIVKTISNIKKTDSTNKYEITKQSSISSDMTKTNGMKNTILHKIKDTTGKIVKSSLTKLNATAINLNCAQLNEIKHLIKPIQKPISTVVVKKAGQLKLNNKNINPQSTKFSDNSSDSGFDENLDRKSVSPTEVERISVPETSTKSIMYLTTNGKDIQRTQQNHIVTKNENTAELLKSRFK